MKENIKVGLISMPQSLTVFPSIGLTQIASILKNKFGDRITTDIMYPCLDYICHVGLSNYNQLQKDGLNQWIFRNEAFPEVEDNLPQISEYYFSGEKTSLRTKSFQLAIEKKENIGAFLDGLIDQYHLLEYDVIGFTSVVSQNIAAFALARKIKDKNPSTIIIMGGPNCNYPMGKVIIDKIDDIDFVFAGVSIISFPAFIQCLLNEDKESCHKINGIFSKKNKIKGHDMNEYKEKSVEYLVEQIGDYHDINLCIDLDYDSFLMKFEEFRKKTGFPHKPILLFETGMGCWKRDALPCTFCGLNNPNQCFTSMNPKLAITYIQKIIDRYSDQCTVFDCVDNILDKKYIYQVFPFLKIPKGIMLAYQTSAALTKEEMNICANSGVKILQPGIESLNTDELKLMQKGISSFTNILFLKHCIETGIYPTWNYLYGVPGKCDSSHFTNVIEMLPLLRHLPPPASLGPITFVRYSPFFEKSEEYGLELRPNKEYYDLYPFEDAAIENVASDFYDLGENAEYKQLAESYIPEINMEILEWMMAYRISDVFPQLYFKSENVIFDSRFNIDDPIIFSLTKLQKEVLMELEKPMTLKQLESIFPYNSKEEIRNAFNTLNRNKLLFCDGDRYLSLVCSKYSWSKKEFEQLINKIALSTSSSFE